MLQTDIADTVDAVLSPVNLLHLWPASMRHPSVFTEVVTGLHAGLINHGYTVSLSERDLRGDAINIVFGAHLMSDARLRALPDNVILYNLEQIDPDSKITRPAYLEALAAHRYWDYSYYNLLRLKQRYPQTRAVHVPVGYEPQLARLHKRDEDIDVLFYGSLNDRRKHVIDSLHNAGIRVVAAYGVFNEELDRLIERAKIVLNLHYYANSHILEVVRVAFLMANRKAVVSEYVGHTEIYPHLRSGLLLSAHDRIVGNCLRLLSDAQSRTALEVRAFDAISQVTWTQLLTGVDIELQDNTQTHVNCV